MQQYQIQGQTGVQDQLLTHEDLLKHALQHSLVFTRTLLELKYRYQSNGELYIKKLNLLFEQMHRSQSAKDGIIALADVLYNYIIRKTKQNFAKLTEKELLLLALCRLGFTTIEILVFLQLNSTNHIYQLKFRLCKKLQVHSLNEYFQRF